MPNSMIEERLELIYIKPQYTLIRDVLAGEREVKGKRTTYLPQPNPTDTSEENKKRYDDYLTRAVFYNVTGRTVEGLIGQIFLRDPIVELPKILEGLLTNIDGAGSTIKQLARVACGHVISYGRGGLLVDFPKADEPVSIAEIENYQMQPMIKFVAPWDIVNWEVKFIRNIETLTFLVIREFYEERETGTFKVERYEQYRVYDLDEGYCRCRLVNKDFEVIDEAFLKDKTGKNISEIPFVFLGSENNDSRIDSPPIYDMATLNIAHYRNSADHEESTYMLGQPTPIFVGLTEEWVANQLNGKVMLGSRAAVPLPIDADAKLLQVSPNTLASEAMQYKEKQMIALGAKLVEQRKIEATATEIELNNAADSSVLSSIADNVELGIRKALKIASYFVDASGEIKFTLNKNFDLTSLTAEEVRWLLEAWAKGSIAFSELRAALHRSGIATLNVSEAQAEILKDVEFRKKVSIEMQPQSSVSKSASSPER